MGVFLPRALDWRGCDVQKYLLIWAGKYEKEWAKFGLGISIILRRRIWIYANGCHTHARSCQNCQRRRTRTMNGTSILHIFCPRAQTNIFVRSGKGETIEKRASKRRWKLLLFGGKLVTKLRFLTRGRYYLAGNTWLDYDFLHVEDIWREALDSSLELHVEDIIWRETLDSTTISDFRQPQQSGALNEAICYTCAN